MIVVNGTEYRTLSDELMVNGRKVYKAYANGKLVYPEPLRYDARNYYIVATGEGSHTNRYDPRDLKSPLSQIDIRVTWIVRFRCESVTLSGLDASIVDIQPLDDGDYFHVWTIIGVNASGGGSYDQKNGSSVTHVEQMDALFKVNGTYKLKRTDFGGGAYWGTSFVLLNMGDLGYAGIEGPPNNPLIWDLSELMAFAIRPVNSARNRDVSAHRYNDDTGHVSFSTLEFGFGDLFRITPPSSKPWIFYSTMPGPPKVHPSSAKLYMPGEELPDVVADVDSIEEYDYRTAPSA